MTWEDHDYTTAGLERDLLAVLLYIACMMKRSM